VVTNVVVLVIHATKEDYTSLACSMLTNFCVVIKQRLVVVVLFHNLIQNVLTDVKDIVHMHNVLINAKMLASLAINPVHGDANITSVQENVLKVVIVSDVTTLVHVLTSVVMNALESVGSHVLMCVIFVMRRNFHNFMCP